MANPGTVYLLHFSTPYEHAKHYLGWAEDVQERLREHQAGRGARLTQVVVDAGISLILARVWKGGRTLERALKNLKNAPKLCPICNPNAMRRAKGEE